jgi:GNAT superfamily N-acetyltransferase
MSHLWSSEHFFITDDPDAIDFNVVHGFLSTCYWSHSIPQDVVRRAIDHSLCFSIFAIAPSQDQPPAQVGFARVITDHATFAYLCDVFVLESHRGHGLSKRLMESIIAHPALQGLRRFCLLTRDAHGLYAQYGFTPMPDPTRYMEVARSDMYRAR